MVLWKVVQLVFVHGIHVCCHEAFGSVHIGEFLIGVFPLVEKLIAPTESVVSVQLAICRAVHVHHVTTSCSSA
ncbi:hypothetical protein BRADI_4g14951v3 [Brachypodium distachyon]|uniref:Uncharacterized protein n=1 Tax=Brachypodium distachyon TaxID=15368 RepID=A0A2K2CMX8_BRADI|nr:hypothetical protein BRADI_4g14951v3 [Brachypodium distachyon]